MTTVEVFAPAKINLTLHVTGQRPNGYHELDSLVVFAPDVGDVVRVRSADDDRFSVEGPFAADVPVTEDNLVCRAARLMGQGFDITLVKNLPVASGIGGGSSDAAGTLKAIAKLKIMPLPTLGEQTALGADVPVCVMGGAVRMQGIGEMLSPVATGAFGWPMVLVNPGVSVSTPDVFRQLSRKENPPMADVFELGPTPLQDDRLPDWLRRQRNDLEEPAIAVAPVIRDVLSALQDTAGCQIARMSGSGATCFGLFFDERDARAAAEAIETAHPDWWVAASTGPGP